LNSNRSSGGGGPVLLPDEFARALAAAGPRLGRLDSPVLFFPVTDSTNDVALALAASGECEGAVVLADEQRAGRGRRGHRWFSPAGSGLYVSVVLSPGRSSGDPARATSVLTLMVGVALAEGIEAATGLAVDLKWPNDLYVSGRKLGGVLAEASRGVWDPPSVVVGYGINVRAAAYPPELRDRATSLDTELGRPVDRGLVFVETIASLAGRYDDLLAGRFDAILDAWRGRAPNCVGAPVAWTTGFARASGVTAGIDDRGALLVLCGAHLERIVAGEVTWLAPEDPTCC
jgi:BirA family biotin operon repressor/biotin-[acetyl-CoA-carboxylase] ligase